MLAGIGKTYPAPSWAIRSTGVLRVRNSYESASVGRRTRNWNAPTLGPNDSTLPSLRLLRDRSRKAYRDEAYGGGAIDHRVEQLIGCGITPRSLAPDAAFRERVHALWQEWADESDADGLQDFYGQQSQATQCWQEAGEVFARLRPRLPGDMRTVPLQVQLLEPELCPLEDTITAPARGNRVRAGIEFSPIGRREAYWFYRQRPGDPQDLSTAELVRVPAAGVAHMYLPGRAGQIRGVPHLHRALMTLRDLDVGDDATLLRWQLGNMLVGWMTRPGGDQAPTLDPRTGKPIEKNADGVPEISLVPGAFYDLEPGEDIKFSQPPEAGSTYEAFMRQQLRKVATATRTPYHALTGDLSQINDRTIRVILQDFRRGLEQLQERVIVFQFCRPVWSAWFERAVLSGVLDVPDAYYADPAPWQAVEWVPDRWPYIHPVQDVEAEEKQVRAGFTSRMRVVKGRGYDVETIDRERADDNARDRELGLKSDSDASATDRAGKPSEPKPADDPAPDPAVAAALEVARAAASRPITVESHVDVAEGAVRAGDVHVNAPVTVDAPTTIAEGAIHAPVTLGDGAVRVENAITVPPAVAVPEPRTRIVDKELRLDDRGRTVGVHEKHTTQD